jgi:MFS transporter, UMF1 family
MAMTHAPHAPPVLRPDGEIRPTAHVPARERWGWAWYDFANTIFSMNVTTLFFTVWFIKDLGGTNTQLSVASAISSALVALSIPILGAVSDARRRRVPWVIGFTLVAVVGMALLGVIGNTTLPLIGENVIGGAPADTPLPTLTALLPLLVMYVIANYAYQGALPFYNAMLPELAPPSEQGRLSGIGTALGYVGSIAGVIVGMLFMAGAIPGVLKMPAGLVSALRSIVPFSAHGGRVGVFFPSALLFLLTALPLFLFCRDHNPAPKGAPVRVKQAFADLRQTLRDAKQHPGAMRFIITSLLYQDALGTIISVMALYAVKAVGFEDGMDTTLFLILTVPAVVGSYVLGHVCDRKGPKFTLSFVLLAWIVLLVGMLAAPITGRGLFWVVGVGIGLIFGGIGTAERPMMLSLVPDAEAGRFFSLMVLSSRAAAIVGPLVWGFTVDGLIPHVGERAAYQAGLATLTIAMVFAWWLLRGVPDTRKAAGDPGMSDRAATARG